VLTALIAPAEAAGAKDNIYFMVKLPISKMIILVHGAYKQG
jgi:hypothetical protein